ncbi:MAG: DUF1080 domain-containing protein [Planctomycetes bacterium]|nr:DUF1080 domain-containing protein [Planctomycetota bacterium]
MRLLIPFLFPLVCLAQSVHSEDPTKPPVRTGDAQSMFNGKDLTGWDGDPSMWSVRDGVIRGETTPSNPAKGNTFLIWKGGEVKNFELFVKFRSTASNNSGIQYRSRHITDGGTKNNWVVRGYQHEIRNELAFPNVSGFIYDEGGKRGRLCLVGEKSSWEADGKKVTQKLIEEAAFKKLFHLDDWNEAVIVARGNHLQHFLNGQLILEFVDNEPALALSQGIIALQLHAGNPMWVEFKDLELRTLSD